MKKDQIRTETQAHLEKLGFARGSYVWQPNLAQLTLVVGGSIEIFTLKSGISRRQFTYELGVIAGLARAAGVQPKPKANGSARLTELPAHQGSV